MKKLVLIFILLLPLVSIGQVPGYMGKRVYLYYGGTGMPTVGAFFMNETAFDVNIKQQLGVDFVLSRRNVLGVSVELINDYMILHDEEGYYGGSSLGVIFGPSILLNYKGFLFRDRGSIAPVGWYSSFSIGANHVNVTDNGKYFPSGKTDLGSYNTGIFTFGYGKQTVLWDRITFDTGVRFGASYSGILTLLKDVDDLGMDEISQKANTKVFANYLFNVNLSFGWLVK